MAQRVTPDMLSDWDAHKATMYGRARLLMILQAHPTNPPPRDATKIVIPSHHFQRNQRDRPQIAPRWPQWYVILSLPVSFQHWLIFHRSAASGAEERRGLLRDLCWHVVMTESPTVEQAVEALTHAAPVHFRPSLPSVCRVVPFR